MKQPSPEKVSVIMSAYNHAPFVGAAIESVLSQSHENIEFLISDDGSTDGTADIISSYKDARISFDASRVNKGACTSINELIEKTTSEHVCIINSDDIWPNPEKITLQLDILKSLNQVAAVFGRAGYINEAGESLVKENLEGGLVFDQSNRSQGQWLERFFMLGNCFCHPSMMIRRNCYERLGFYKNALRQVPDFEMWVRLLKRHDVFISEETLVNFRLLPGRNASCNLGKNYPRIINEHYLVNRNFFLEISDKVFIEGFSQHFVNKGAMDSRHLEVEKTLLYFHSGSIFQRTNQIIGLEKIYSLLQEADTRELLSTEYGIDDHWFHEKASQVNVMSDREINENIVAKLQAENYLLSRKVEDMHRSLSWKITTPFRALRDLLPQ